MGQDNHAVLVAQEKFEGVERVFDAGGVLDLFAFDGDVVIGANQDGFSGNLIDVAVKFFHSGKVG